MLFAIIPNVPPNSKRSQKFINTEKCCFQGLTAAGLTIVDEDENPEHCLVLSSNKDILDQIAALETAGVSPAPSLASMQYYRKKLAQNTVMAAAGVLAPKTIRIRYGTSFSEVEAALGLPFYLKPDAGYGEMQLKVVMKEADFEARSGFIAQQVVGRPGTDLSVALVKDEAVAAFKRINLDPMASISASDTFRTVLFPDCTFENFPINAELQVLATTVHSLFGNEISSMNLLISRTGNLYFNEVNQIKSMVAFQEICGVNPYEAYGLKLMAAKV